MSIRKRGNRFIIDFYPYGRKGKRVRITLPDVIDNIHDAKKIEEDIKKAYKKETPQIITQDLTIAELLPHYLAWYELHRSKTSYETMKFQAEKYIQKILGNVRLSEMNEHQINLYKRIRLKENVLNRTINRELCGISGLLSWARKQGYQVPYLKIEKMPYKRPLPNVLTPDEVFRFLSVLDDFYRAFFLFLYTAGLRFSEARNLKWEHVNFEARYFKVKQKGGAEKILPLNNLLHEALLKIIPQKTDKGYIFASKKTKRPIVNVRCTIRNACIEAGIRKKVNCHLFRHSIATHMLAKDINLRIIQQYLGHRQVQTTEFYTHVSLEHLNKASDKVLEEYGDYNNILKLQPHSDSVTTEEND